MKKARIKLLYIPTFNGPIEGYVVNFLRSQRWRTKALMEHDDLLQEAYLVFLRLSKKYPRIDTPQHFMALFKTSWYRHYTDLAYADSNLRIIPVESQLQKSEDSDPIEAVGDLDNDGMLMTMIRQAPTEVKQVLMLFMQAPTELLEIVQGSWRQRGYDSPYGNKMLCQLLGLQSNADVVGMVRQYFAK